MLRRASFAATTLCVCVAGARAQDANFYVGKQIQFIVRSEAGSGYDQYSRLLGRFMVRHIPGNPSIITINMPGSGGLQAANYVALRAPRDGTVLTMASQGLPLEQALGLVESLQADMNAFNWIGNVSKSNQTLVAWHTSPVHSIRDAIEKPSIFGTAGAGSISAQLPAAFNALIGTKFQLVFGYPGTGELAVAMERGEIHISDFTLASIRALRPDFLSQGLVTPIAQVGLERERDLAETPLMRELARSSGDLPAIDYLSKAVAVGRPVATTPGVARERVAVLRKAFDETLVDPEFLAEAATARLEIKPMSGMELQGIVRDLIAAPPDVLARVREAIQPRGATTKH